MSIFDFLKTQILFDTQSQYSGHVQVTKSFGVTKLLSDGVTQSADYLSAYAKAGYWKKGADIIISQVPQANSVLFLGMGSGTAIRYISSALPEANLVAVEIDPAMIEVAKRFFGLSDVPNLAIVNADAFSYIKNSGTFDVLFVDMFRGGFFVPVADFDEFFSQLKSITNTGGLVLFNYTFKKNEASQRITDFTGRMGVHFSNISYAVVPGSSETSNYLIYGCN